MKVLIIYPYFGTPKGSWSTRMYELSQRWVSYNTEVEVITAPYTKSDIRASSFIESQTIEGINLTVINSGDDNRLSTLNRAIRSIIFSITATFLVIIKRYDILIASSGPITVGIPMIFAKYIRRKRVVFEIRDLWPEGAIQMKKITNPFVIYIARLFEKICYQSANEIVAASPGMSDEIKSILNSKRNIHVFPNACDIELFHKPRTTPSAFINSLEGKSIIIYAGSLGFMDECATAIKAMEYFSDKNLALVFIGDGADKKDLEKLALKTKNSNIHFLGLISKIEVAKWYSIADASLVGFKNYSFLSTSSPNKMFDSFAAGVPVIQNTNGWIKDLIIEHGGGFNVQCYSVESYIQVFKKVINNKIELESHGQKAYALARTKFSRDIVAREYYKMLKNII